MNTTHTPTTPACLTQVLGSLFRAQAGQIALTLTDVAGNSDFNMAHCRVRDTSVTPSVAVANDTLTVKKWCFTLAAGKTYDVQLVVAQIPATGSKAKLEACDSDLMEIDSTNQIQTWKVQS